MQVCIVHGHLVTTLCVCVCVLVVVECVANLLKLDVYQLSDALTQRFMVLRGEQITTPLTLEQVGNCMCSSVKILYANFTDFHV